MLPQINPHSFCRSFIARYCRSSAAQASQKATLELSSLLQHCAGDPRMVSAVMRTWRTSDPGTSCIGSSNTFSMIPLKPLAPPPRSMAFKHTSSSAALVNLISTPMLPNCYWYCEISDPFTSVNIRRKSETVSGDSIAIEGTRETNSGINLTVANNQNSWLEDR